MAILKKNRQEASQKRQSHQAILLLGGNLGNVLEIFGQAAHFFEQKGRLLSQSSVFKSEAWGMDDAPDFLNKVICVEIEFSPEELLEHALYVERTLGRERKEGKEGYSSRTIDIDILFFDDLVINTSDLIIPHPRLQERKFVLEPLCEIRPDLIHPVFHKTMEELNQEVDDNLRVEVYNE